jgi:RHS repeat-associated protein
MFLFSDVITLKNNYNFINSYIEFTYLVKKSKLFPMPLNVPLDSSALFNERGYSKSSKVSLDEHEIINDFNGDLSYRIPLFNFKGPGDMSVDLSLNYSGSVSQSLVMSSRAAHEFPYKYYYQENGTLYQYSYSSPAWFLSLNGVGVQMLQFETHYYTENQTPGDSYITDNWVKFLAKGYGITKKDGTPSNNNEVTRDEIYILKGDGSIEELKNYRAGYPNPFPPGQNYMNQTIGLYVSKNKGSFARAIVEYLPGPNTPGEINRQIIGSDGPSFNQGQFNLRRMYYMPGDGLTYIYEEYRNEFYDANREMYLNPDFPYQPNLCPKVFLLKSIKDRFGNHLDLEYQYKWGSNFFPGRPLLKKINFINWSNCSPIVIDYFNGPSYEPNIVKITNTVSGDPVTNPSFTIETNKKFTFEDGGSDKNRRTMVSRILNPEGYAMNFQYSDYARSAIGLYFGNTEWFGGYRKIKLNALQRLSSFKNYTGLSEFLYEYTQRTYNEELIMGTVDEYHTIQTQSKNPITGEFDTKDYRGMGRDLFFANMLSKKITKLQNVAITEERFTYFYADNGSKTRFTNPIDDNDMYTTTRDVECLDTTNLFQTPSIYSTLRVYKIFKVRDYLVNAVSHDYQAVIKLVQEQFGTNGAFFKAIVYNLELGNSHQTNNGNGVYYDGSFNLLSTQITYSGVGTISKTFQYTYMQRSNSVDSPFYLLLENSFDNPVSQVRSTDFLNRLTESNYIFIFKKGYRSYGDGWFNPSPPPFNIQDYDKYNKYFYLVGINTQELKYETSRVRLIAKKTNQYLLDSDPTNPTKAYIGQLIESRIVDPGNDNNFLSTTYEYGHNETLGADIYPLMTDKPSIEGNLIKITSPKGNISKFYYHPVSFDENTLDPPTPVKPQKISFHQVLTDGDSLHLSAPFEDRRVPIRTEFFPFPSYAINKYEKKDDALNLIMDVSPTLEKNISTFFYTKDKRNTRIISPYDFNTENYFSMFQGYTLKNNYNNESVEKLLKLDDFIEKKTKTFFDGLYRVRENRIYTNIALNEYDATKTYYNFIGEKAKFEDGLNNSTKYSYDKYKEVSRIENADISSSNVQISYVSILADYFGGSFTKPVMCKYSSDEENIKSEQYFDPEGNLLRQVKFVPGNPSLIPGQSIPVSTDFLYDDLNRLIKVKTPAGKIITYEYDFFGRMIRRFTPDTGYVNYKYDKEGNMIFSQNQNQVNVSANIYNFYVYDGTNRLIGIGESSLETRYPDFKGLDQDYYEFMNLDATDTSLDTKQIGDYLVINIYDKIENAPSGLLTTPYGFNNVSLGNLIAVCYKTRKSDEWSFKYFNYDLRNRVERIWHVIPNIGEKKIDYSYNSQNQITSATYQIDAIDEYKKFIYQYDRAGRLEIVITEDTDPAPLPDFVFVNYSYNKNSQLSSIQLNNQSRGLNYNYNNRGWITSTSSIGKIFRYELEYFNNGNIKRQHFLGEYKNTFSDTSEIYNNFTYDESNRLISTQRFSSSYLDIGIINNYDFDSNLTKMTRNFNEDDFNYQYISGTNKLGKVNGTVNQFAYDNSGNLTTDLFSNNFDMVYDYRNLLIETRCIRAEGMIDPPLLFTYFTRYWYDDKGNRIRKLVMKSDQANPPTPDWNDPNSSIGWTLYRDIHYILDTSGNSIAEYSFGSIDKWNIYGLEHVGSIEQSLEKRFYLKDHLSSIRVIFDENNLITNAMDYDSWGFIVRSFEGINRYKYNSKERDFESGYDYFGSRYYDSRFGRWGGVDRNYDKYLTNSPFNYCVNNPLKIVDKQGTDPWLIIIRTFIPFDITSIPFIGDSRGGSTLSNVGYRTMQSMTFESNSLQSPNIIQSYDAKLGMSHLLVPSVDFSMPDPFKLVPSFISDYGSGDFNFSTYRSETINGVEQVDITMTGYAHVGVLPTWLSGAIDYSLTVKFKVENGGAPQIDFTSQIYKDFPAIEAFVINPRTNEVVARYFSKLPTDPIRGPFKLLSPPTEHRASPAISLPPISGGG